MRFGILAAMLLMAQPALAWDRMLLSDCRAAFETAGEMMPLSDGDAAKLERMVLSMGVTPDGWCQLDNRTDAFEGAAFEMLEWRADGITRWTVDGIAPLGLDIRIKGLEPDAMQGDVVTTRPPLSAEITLRQDPGAGQVVIERLVMSNEVGDLITMSALFDRVFLTSPSMMQVSMGSATFKSGLFLMTLEGTHANPFASELELRVTGDVRAGQEAVFDLISRLPDGVIDDASRAELMAYAGDLPKPVGTLEVSVNSQRGLGMMQLGAAIYKSFAASFAEPEAAFSGLDLGVLLDGVTVRADWTPAAQVAD